jgi:hypothetical protein
MLEQVTGSVSVAGIQNELCVSVIQGERSSTFADKFCKPSPSSREWGEKLTIHLYAGSFSV